MFSVLGTMFYVAYLFSWLNSRRVRSLTMVDLCSYAHSVTNKLVDQGLHTV